LHYLSALFFFYHYYHVLPRFTLLGENNVNVDTMDSEKCEQPSYQTAAASLGTSENVHDLDVNI